MAEDDKLRIHMVEHEGQVVLTFGASVTKIGFLPDKAREFASAMIAMADKIAAQCASSDAPIT